MVGNLPFKLGVLSRQLTAVLFCTLMPCTGLMDIVTTGESPLLVDLGKLIVPLYQSLPEILGLI